MNIYGIFPPSCLQPLLTGRFQYIESRTATKSDFYSFFQVGSLLRTTSCNLSTYTTKIFEYLASLVTSQSRLRWPARAGCGPCRARGGRTPPCHQPAWLGARHRSFALFVLICHNSEEAGLLVRYAVSLLSQVKPVNTKTVPSVRTTASSKRNFLLECL